jgi:hypothetical protein
MYEGRPESKDRLAIKKNKQNKNWKSTSTDKTGNPMSKEWKISDSQKQHFTTNLVAGEIQEDQLKDGQTSEHRNRQ